MALGRVDVFPVRRRTRRLLVLAIVLALLTPVGVSLERSLTYPGSASWKLRLVEWTREHGGASLVNTVEDWYYTRQRPGSGPPPAGSMVPLASPAASRNVSGVGRPAAIAPLVTPAADGEGAWQALGRTGRGRRPYVWATWFRPDPASTSVTVAAAEIAQDGVRTRLIAGTRDPGGVWPEGARVPPGDRSHLVAAFNAGFMFGDTKGGFAADGRTSKPLVDGLATAVIDARGRLAVERWTSGPSLPPGLIAARQNLDLIVEGGRPVPGLHESSAGRWGTDRNQLQYTWRSALGTTADGRLLYVAGDHLDLTDIAVALAHAGAVVGMQLDIHAALVTFNAFSPGPRGPTGEKLVPAMSRPADRYLAADQRDFFAVLAR
jgi:hypothetical protein